jgi:hypothetical protein
VWQLAFLPRAESILLSDTQVAIPCFATAVSIADEPIGHKLTRLCRGEGDGENPRPTAAAASVLAAGSRPQYADRRPAAP